MYSPRGVEKERYARLSPKPRFRDDVDVVEGWFETVTKLYIVTLQCFANETANRILRTMLTDLMGSGGSFGLASAGISRTLDVWTCED